MKRFDDEEPLSLLEANVASPTSELVERSIFRGGALGAFGYRDFRLLWSGALLSNVGTWIHMSVLLWYVKELTDSNTWVSVVNMANFIPVVFFVLYSGSLADRLDRRKLILATQTVMMFTALALGISMSAGWASLVLVIAITFVMGVAFAFNFPAWRAMVPDLVPPEEMLNGLALDASQFNMARFVGPALGGLIFNLWNVAGAFYVNAASFFAVIIALLMIRTTTEVSAPPPESTFEHIKEALRYCALERWAAYLLAILAVASVFGLSSVVLLPAIARDVLHKGNWGYSFLMGALGLGAVLGAPMVTVLNRRLKERDIIKLSLLCASILLMGMALSHVYLLSLLIAVFLGIFFLMGTAAINTVLQSRVERHMRGRIMSLYILVFQGMAPLGGLVLGYLSDLKSTPFSLFLGGSVCLTGATVLLVFPQILRGAVSHHPVSLR